MIKTNGVETCRYCKFFGKSVNENPCKNCMHSYESKYEPARVIDVLRNGTEDEIVKLLKHIDETKGDESLEVFLFRSAYEN